jgi:hypothetical protein
MITMSRALGTSGVAKVFDLWYFGHLTVIEDCLLF